MTYFTARSTLVPYAFEWEKGKTMDLSETIAVNDIKVGGCSQLNEYNISLCEYQRSRSFTDLRRRSLRFNISKLLSLETARPIEAKFYVEPPCDEGMKSNINGLCHMTNMSVMSIYGEKL